MVHATLPHGYFVVSTSLPGRSVFGFLENGFVKIDEEIANAIKKWLEIEKDQVKS